MFTVCIPSYNHAKYLTSAIVSALRSPLVTEVLVVDDGSTDGSVALLGWLTRLGPRLRVLPGGDNRGAHARLNELVLAARTEWVAVLNSDDTLVPGRFEAIERVARQGQAELIFGDLVLIDGQGERLGLRHAIRHNEVPWPPRWDLNQMARDQAWAPMLALQNIVATTTNMVFTRSVHQDLGGFRDYRYCHDWDFALRAALAARVRYVPAMMAQYRLHGANTIKESGDRVRHEVRRMFARLMSERLMSERLVGNDPTPEPWLATIVRANHYMQPPGGPVLGVVLPDPIAAAILARQAARLPVTVVAHEGALTHEPYLYAPGPAGAAALRLQDLRTILLAVATAQYDALLLNRTAGPVTEPGLADALVVRRAAVGTWRTGAVQTIALYPMAPFVGGSPVRLADAAPGAGAPMPGPGPMPMPAPAWDDPRPVVFVLPAFLAMGGAERLTISIMRALQDRWRFVVVNTEPLRPEQGSTHDDAAGVAEIYDLAEIASDRLAALAILRDWYNPALLWIMNGAPWQVEHATQIRDVFRGVPVADNQAYDHEAGWINRFGDPGVRDAERFVAINNKIAHAMRERFGIAADRIDLIYHGAEMARATPRPVGPGHVAEIRRGFGLDPALPTFGMIGRLSAQKRPMDLVALAKRAGPRVQFAWTGPGELASEVASAAPANFHLIPSQADVRPVLEMLDGLVITSEFEGLPVAMLEALAMGVPVLSTDVGAIGEVLARYGSGMIWGPPGDIPALLAAFKAFRRALPGLRAAAQAAAPRVAEEFSSARMALEYEATFRKAIS